MADGGSTAKSSDQRTSQLPRGVLARSGLPLPAGTRLNSLLRPPRDLTLGGKVGSKKTMAPNIVPNIVSKSSSASDMTNGASRDGVSRGGRGWNSRGRGRGSRGRDAGESVAQRGRGGRGGRRDNANLVQLDGIFEAGTVSASTYAGGYSSGSGAGGSSGVSSGPGKDSSLPKYVPMEQEDCDDTQETIDRLTKSESLDYGEEPCGELPLMIPLMAARYGTTGCKVEDCTDSQKDGGYSQSSLMEVDETQEKKEPVKQERCPSPEDVSAMARHMLARLCLGHESSKAEDEGKTLTVFQLPRLPGPSRVSQDTSQRSSSSNSKGDPKTHPMPNQYRLKDLPRGYIGKLQVLRDGRVRMLSGNVSMELQMASELPLYQELVDIQSKMVVPLGKVENKVVCRLNPKDLIRVPGASDKDNP